MMWFAPDEWPYAITQGKFAATGSPGKPTVTTS